ncbi:MAG TPA: TylF/MycF/NovP-related O-methyltransferase [Allosphingosinicella sp.]
MRIFSELSRRLRLRGLSRTARAVLRDRLTYLAPAKMRRLEAELGRVRRNDVPGDLLEFGVALGGSAILIAGHADEGRRFHGFDVFDMIPPPTSDKDDERSKARYETIASGRSKGIAGDEYYGYRENLFEEVKASFARYGVPVNGGAVQLHKGLFEETWPKLDIRTVAFAHVDCDWYDPVRFCLDEVADRLSPGGAVLIDDYHDYGGCREAVNEFLARRSDFALEPGPNPILRKRPQRKA